MKMFLGEYNPNITEGSRIALPKKIREQIDSNSVVMTKGFEKCIYIYDKSDWQEQAEKQIENAKEDNQNAKIRDLERYIYTSASEGSVDTQGRVVLPANLLEYAEITSRTAVVGVGNRVEVWDGKLWKERSEKISEELSE